MPNAKRATIPVVLAVMFASVGCQADTPTPPIQYPSTSPLPQASPAPALHYPVTGSGNWTYALAGGDIAGHSGQLMRYRIAVEEDITGVDPTEIAGEIRTILGDPRGWTAGGDWRFQQVGADEPVDFTIYLATPATRDKLCGGSPDGYTSCRNGASVVLNVARWVDGVPGYGAPLSTYREYMVTHETGHRLGHRHEHGPGPGQLAPVMQQQTLGLRGCLPNPWPYPNSRRDAGLPGEYNG
ncbi:DUF3152 domain-containing protein [Saccharopolyspora shandongensis]|uniref:DUF3152 domain-containing protein n=1 Tax=Saccharopolyspora shandongensis TaxID=418495 RepID=UPI0034106B6B